MDSTIIIDGFFKAAAYCTCLGCFVGPLRCPRLAPWLNVRRSRLVLNCSRLDLRGLRLEFYCSRLRDRSLCMRNDPRKEGRKEVYYSGEVPKEERPYPPYTVQEKDSATEHFGSYRCSVPVCK